jgi:glucose/arabinose dehydrogenase
MNPGRTGFQFVDSYLADNELDSGESDSPIRFGQDFGAITDIETGPDGNLYVTSISNGVIYRIRPLSASAEHWELYD